MNNYDDQMGMYDDLLELIEEVVDEVLSRVEVPKDDLQLLAAQRVFEEFVMLSSRNDIEAIEYIDRFCDDFRVFMHNKSWNQIH